MQALLHATEEVSGVTSSQWVPLQSMALQQLVQTTSARTVLFYEFRLQPLTQLKGISELGSWTHNQLRHTPDTSAGQTFGKKKKGGAGYDGQTADRGEKTIITSPPPPVPLQKCTGQRKFCVEGLASRSPGAHILLKKYLANILIKNNASRKQTYANFTKNFKINKKCL